MAWIKDAPELVRSGIDAINLKGTPWNIRVTNASKLDVDIQFYDLHWQSSRSKLLENQSKVMAAVCERVGRRCYHCRVWQNDLPDSAVLEVVMEDGSRVNCLGTFCVFGNEIERNHNNFELRNVEGRIQPFFKGEQKRWAVGGH